MLFWVHIAVRQIILLPGRDIISQAYHAAKRNVIDCGSPPRVCDVPPKISYMG